MLDQLIAVAATIISTGVFLDRYGIPGPGTAFGYFLFGVLFVTLGVFIGKMLDTTTFNLLLMREWNVNISLMVIGYSTIIAALVGWGVKIKSLISDPEGDESQQP